MTKLRVFAKRPTPLEDLNIVTINDFNTEFTVDLGQQLDDNEPTLVHSETFTPSTGPVTPPTPEPGEGKILWQSKGIWDNGHARTMTDHHEYDPDDPLSEVAAGGHGTAREWRIPGDSNHSFLSGGMSRVYTHTPHDGKIMFECVMVWNKSQEPNDGNLSLEWYSRHNEGGDPKNRRGGVTVSFHKNSVESKEEYYHAVYTKGQSKDLPKALEDGKSYPIKVLGSRTADKDKAVTTLEPFIDYGDGMKSLGVFTQKVTSKQEPGLQEPSLYWRWRVNGTAPKDVEVKDMVFTQL